VILFIEGTFDFLRSIGFGRGRMEKGEPMITLVIGLFIGALLGFVLAAIIARGKTADEYDS
jgi:hypothetical protein